MVLARERVPAARCNRLVKLLAAIAAVPFALAGGSSGVSPGPSMTVPRSAHTATLLADGRVLLVGGLGGGERTAELYDPRRRLFSRAAPPPTGRVGHAAVGLRDGRVLVAGGWTREGGDALARADLYDPRRDAWERTGSLSTTRGGFTATRLRDGRVLVAGGVADGRTLRSAELYEPAKGAWRHTGTMRSPRNAHSATLHGDGRVLLAGGSASRGRVLAAAEVYDPRHGTFRAVGRLRTARHKHAAMTLRDGRVLLIGGSSSRDWYARYRSSEVFDPPSGRFSAEPRLADARFKLDGAVVRLPDGRVVVAGGARRVETYVPRTGRFAVEAGRVDGALSFSTATVLMDGRVLVAGGYDSAIRSTARAWLVRAARR